jgi:leucyl/phenylalanyl-tRNA--protein transferase
MHVYAQAYDAGAAHSFEVWNENGVLVGGGYGLAIGGAFVTESQFSHEPNTSKIGLTVLNWHLARWGFAFNDGKLMTPTCHDMGFRDNARTEFLNLLAKAGRKPGRPGRWQVEGDVATVADWKPAG